MEENYEEKTNIKALKKAMSFLKNSLENVKTTNFL